MNVADLNAYKEFLKNPPPKWISKTGWPRRDPRYRQFTGRLFDAGRRQAMVAMQGLMGFAEQTGDLRPGARLNDIVSALQRALVARGPRQGQPAAPPAGADEAAGDLPF